MMVASDQPAARWRVFVAAWPDDSLLDALEPLDRWLNRHRTHRVIPRDQRHLTLAFLGDVEASIAETLAARYRAAFCDAPPAQAPVEGVIGIPTAAKARVVAVGLERRPELLSLMERVLLETAEAAPVETVLRDLDRHRLPHITVARTRRSEQARRLDMSTAPRIEGAFTVSSIRIVRSHLTPQGPQYEVVSEVGVCAG